MSSIGVKSGKSEVEHLSSFGKYVTGKVCKVEGIWPLEIKID